MGLSEIKKLLASALISCFIVSASAAVAQAAEQKEPDFQLVKEHKGKAVGAAAGCVAFFPLGCVVGFLIGWIYDGVVEPTLFAESRHIRMAQAR